VAGLGWGFQKAGEAAGEQVVVLGRRGGWRVVGRGAARGEGEGSALELAAGVVQGGLDLIVDGAGRSGIGRAAGRWPCRPAFQIFGQAGGRQPAETRQWVAGSWARSFGDLGAA